MVVQPTQVQRQPRDIGCCLIFFVVVSASFGALSYAYQKAGGWCFMMFHSMFKKKIRANYDRKQSAVALAYDESLHLPPGQSSWLPGTTRFFGTKMWRGHCCQDAALSLHLPRSAELQHRNRLSQNISENLRNWRQFGSFCQFCQLPWRLGQDELDETMPNMVLESFKNMHSKSKQKRALAS